MRLLGAVLFAVSNGIIDVMMDFDEYLAMKETSLAGENDSLDKQAAHSESEGKC